MSRIKALVAVCLAVGLVASAAPAEARSTTIQDPAGDAAGAGLDITGARLSNRDQAFTADLTFAADTPGNVIVAVGARGGHPFRIISKHTSHGADDAFLLNDSGEPVACHGLASTWDRPAAGLTLVVPSRCLDRGDYGAVHSWILTEDGSGRDIDYAPEDSHGDLRYTPWIPRG